MYADSCEVDDIWGKRPQRDCIELMERMWGPPQASVEKIDPKVTLAAEGMVIFVWFLESVARSLPE